MRSYIDIINEAQLNEDGESIQGFIKRWLAPYHPFYATDKKSASGLLKSVDGVGLFVTFSFDSRTADGQLNPSNRTNILNIRIGAAHEQNGKPGDQMIPITSTFLEGNEVNGGEAEKWLNSVVETCVALFDLKGGGNDTREWTPLQQQHRDINLQIGKAFKNTMHGLGAPKAATLPSTPPAMV